MKWTSLAPKSKSCIAAASSQVEEGLYGHDGEVPLLGPLLPTHSRPPRLIRQNAAVKFSLPRAFSLAAPLLSGGGGSSKEQRYSFHATHLRPPTLDWATSRRASAREDGPAVQFRHTRPGRARPDSSGRVLPAKPGLQRPNCPEPKTLGLSFVVCPHILFRILCVRACVCVDGFAGVSSLLLGYEVRALFLIPLPVQ